MPVFYAQDFFTIFISPTFAQNENPPDLVTGPSYGGLDLVFLVDQSGSMRINDPYEQRINTIKWVVESLGIDNLYFRPDAANRIGIVSFGTDARIDLPLVPLKVTESGQPATADLERVLRDRIKNDIEPKIMADSMGNTDVLRGLGFVKQVFDEAPPAQQAVASAPRNRGIIILTDGSRMSKVGVKIQDMQIPISILRIFGNSRHIFAIISPLPPAHDLLMGITSGY
ncbi:MAG: VWA domain-containing protein [Anaerolineae bacterium]|nr:MAG: VWA domain-containing protein [Anaerolineae bacterium]